MNKVFIVEDDAVIARAVAAHLTTWQMQVQCAGNFEKITEEVEDFQPDIIIMDIKLPYYNGFYWCAEIRKTSKVPIVFLSSADDNMNIVMAMNMGGDDFIANVYPFEDAAKAFADFANNPGDMLKVVFDFSSINK